MNKNLKKVISSVAVLAMSASCFTAFAADFSDVADTAAYKTAIDELVALKIVNGYEDGTFKPDNEITRAEVTKMVVAAMGPSYTAAAESSAATSDFSDCANHWAKGYINVGVAQKFINGMGDGTFSPDTNVTYAQITKMLVAALGYTSAAEGAGGYPNGYLQVGASTGITAGVSGLNADTNVTRAQVAQLIDNALDTPIVAVTGWTTDIYGKPVATTEVMDGTGDSKKYQTLLTEYHDAYSVKGRVTATHAQGTVDADQVEFQVEYSDNFDGEKIAVGKNKNDYSDTATKDTMYFGDTAAEGYLLTYSEAVIQKDENDEYHILSITPYGRNDIVDLSSDDFDSYASDLSTIDFTVSSTSSKTKSYKLDNDVVAYVNGIEFNGSTKVKNAIDSYVKNNKIGTVQLVDTPKEGSTSKDGKYDYIMISYENWAIVDSVSESGAKTKIYLDNSDIPGATSVITVDADDDDKSYTFVKDGVETDVKAVTEDSVLLLTYDVTGKINDSNFIKFDICDKVVSGSVDEKAEDSTYTDDKGTEVTTYKYKVDGTYYTTANGISSDIKVGNEYTLYVDAADRIVKVDETASSKNFGIIDKVWRDSNDDKKVRLIKADGTRVSYVARNTNNEYDKASSIAYSTGTELNDVAKRVVSFKLNSKSEIYDITAIKMTDDTSANPSLNVASAEYKESTGKIGAAKLDESTQIIDLSSMNTGAWNDVDKYTSSDIAKGSLDALSDGEDYKVLYGDKSSNTSCHRVVVILEGSAGITVNTRFAVVDSVSTGTFEEDGSERDVINAYTADSADEIKALYMDEDYDKVGGFASSEDVDDLVRGDVIAVSLAADGTVSKIAKLFSAKTTASASALTYADAYKFFQAHNTATAPVVAPYFDSGVAKWDSSAIGAKNGYARVGFGVITDKKNNNVTIGNMEKDSSDNYITNKSYDYTVTSDAKVYVYDMNEKDKSASGRLTAATVGGITPTKLADSYIDDATDTYKWSEAAAAGGLQNANYAFFKTVDGDITDIIVIIPHDDAYANGTLSK